MEQVGGEASSQLSKGWGRSPLNVSLVNIRFSGLEIFAKILISRTVYSWSLNPIFQSVFPLDHLQAQSHCVTNTKVAMYTRR